MINTLDKIEQKILNNERLTKEDGLALFASNDLARIGYLADLVSLTASSRTSSQKAS